MQTSLTPLFLITPAGRDTLASLYRVLQNEFVMLAIGEQQLKVPDTRLETAKNGIQDIINGMGGKA